YAALACGDELPTCQGSFWPDMDFGKGFDLTQEVGPNYLGGTMDNESRVAIQVTHRVGAIVLSVYLIWMVFVLWRQNHASSIRNALLLMSAVLVVQFGLGLSNVILLVPLAIAVAHNAVGALLLLSMMNLNYQIYRLQK
ncbi:heme A synthase, partial [Oleiphilus sp. HI0067]